MKQKIYFVIMWASMLTFFGCGQTNNKPEHKMDKAANAEQYVSMDCQTGDITLTLKSDNNFDRTILLWDDKTNKHTGQETIQGSWTKAGKILTLVTTDNNKIVYELTTTNMKIADHEVNNKAYSFQSNEKDFFGTKFDLLEKEQADQFIKTAIKP